MKTNFKNILILFLFITICSSCSKTPSPEISGQTDQAFLQDITLLDASGKDVTAVKPVVPKTVVDLVTGLERLDVAGTPLIINVTVKAGTDLNNLYIRCILSSQSKFAKVGPVMGGYTNLSSPKVYTVTSQTGKNVNAYTIKVVSQ